MKDIKSYIYEALDVENLLWKIDMWFYNRPEAKGKFMELAAKYKTSKANKDEIEDYLKANNINIEEFINFMDEDVYDGKPKDNLYLFCQIINLINSK